MMETMKRFVLGLILLVSVSAKTQPPLIEGKVTAIEKRASWQQQTKAGVIFSGQASAVKATWYKVETDTGVITVVDRAGSVFHGYPPMLFSVGDRIRMTEPKEAFSYGVRVKVTLPNGKTKRFYLDSDARQ